MALWLGLPVPVLAFATTVHAALVLLRRHRSAAHRGGWLLALPAVGFAATPWMFPTVGGVAAGFVAQVAWFIACEKLAPAPPAPARPAALPPSRAAAAAPAPSRADREFAPVPVLNVHQETPSIRTFRLARPAHFKFEAGQFLTVRLEIDGRPAVRCYSISSAPQSSGYLEISVRRQGLVSNALHDLVRPGAMLSVKPPAGKFVYPANDARPLVLLAGGVGITPLLSMLRHGAAADPTRPISLLYSVRADEDIAFRDELAVLAARHPQVQVRITVGNPAAAGPWRAGHIDEPLVRDVAPYPAGAIYCMCGPAPMMDAMRGLLAGLGVPEAQVRSEVFQAATAIGARPAQGDAAATRATTEGAGTPAMTCTRSNRVVPVPAGVTLLDAAEAAGVQIPSLCRSGVCGTCRSKVVSGEVRCTSDALDEEDRANQFILPCVTWTEGDCVVEV